MDTINQNRITRKKLRKSIKRQAARRKELEIESAERIALLSKRLYNAHNANTDCAKLLELAISDILECVNTGEFLQSGHVDFDLGFMKMSYFGGKFNLRSVRLPDKDDFKNKKGL